MKEMSSVVLWEKVSELSRKSKLVAKSGGLVSENEVLQQNIFEVVVLFIGSRGTRIVKRELDWKSQKIYTFNSS